MSGGYARKILNLDLSTEEMKEERPEEKVYRDFLGGVGMGVWHVYNNQMAGVNPLGPENIIGFITGLLNGTNVPFSGRYTVVGKSPLTNTWGDANSGGFFGPELKQAGYDGIFIKGISKKPVYLLINDGKAEIRDADHIWGKDTTETLDIIRSEVGDEKVRVVSIGPSGEKLSLISCIINDRGRAAARSGLGAVMGSKKVKAIAVRGTKRVPIDDPERLKDVIDRMLKSLRRSSHPITKLMMTLLKPIFPWILRRGVTSMPDVGYITESMIKYGTAMGTSSSSEMGDAPCKNWAGVGYRDFPMRTKSYKISDENVIKYNERKYACAACPIGCGAIVKIEKGSYALEQGHKPEFETLASFGSMPLNDNVESIIKCNDICNRYGLDTISAGATIAFAMECYENNILTKEDTDGIDLTWGNTEAIVRVLEKLAEKDGFGELLSDGVKVAAERIGKGAEKYAMHVHGQEIPMHDPRLNPSFATAYVTDPTPARHTRGGAGIFEIGLSSNPFKEVKLPRVKRFQYKGKGDVHATLSKIQITLDSLGMCQFLGYFGSFPIVDAMEAVTGLDFSTEELMRTGDRIQALRQLFNVREGIRPSDFKLPDRIRGIPPLPVGPSAGKTIDLDTMVEDFYKAMDWSLEDGRPSEEKLKNLGLKEM
ncbi:MAG: aldehyde ferredoxin oxidoreductase family protein [Methanocellales archaeon]|nr:aldehyde ferredoxin oxidoreductase family protein [Methanocellales archaeon]